MRAVKVAKLAVEPELRDEGVSALLSRDTRNPGLTKAEH